MARIILLFSVLGCAHGAGSLATSARAARVVDLTHALDTRMPVWPGGTPYASETLETIERSGYYLNKFTTGEHTGTHVDAPAHFAAGTATIDRIPPEDLVAAAAVIDISARVAGDPDYAVATEDIRGWESRHGALGKGWVVLIRTGWGARWGEPDRYRNADAKGVMHFPGVSVPAARYLLDRGVRGIGIDTLSVDPGTNAAFDEHKVFLAAGGWHIENLASLDALPESGATVIVCPLPLAGGSGAPARVLALLPPNGALRQP
jgi:kynurenine formamidase